MSEWQVTPREINEEWTEELLALMFRKQLERVKRMTAPREDQEEAKPYGVYHRNLSNETFFARHADSIKVTRHHV